VSKTRRGELLEENSRLQNVKFDALVEAEKSRRDLKKAEQGFVNVRLALDNQHKLLQEQSDLLHELMTLWEQTLRENAMLKSQLKAKKIGKIKLKI